MYPIDDETLRVTLAVYKESGDNQTLAAEKLGIARSTLQLRLENATARGLAPYVAGDPLPPGLELHAVTTLFKDDTGRVLQWVKAERPKGIQSDPIPTLKAAFAEFEGKARTLTTMPYEEWAPHLLTVYPIADLHLGMYSWKEETGNDFDIAVADRIFTDTIMDLISRSPASETAVILNLGDFFHSDTNENRTLRSGNALDVDTRYAKVLRAGVDIILQATHLALQKHKRVIIRNLPGNHDPYGSLALTLALQAYFHDHDRVSVDITPGPFFFHKFGRVLIGAAHGDMAKPQQMVNIMSAKRSEDWGATDFRYIYLGHIHRKSRGGGDYNGEFGGAIWETFQTLAPRDAWGNSMGFTAGRSMQSITLHKEFGEWDRKTSAVKGAVV